MTNLRPPEQGVRDHGAHAIGGRALFNTAWRASGELIGKLATLVVYALLAREGGESEVGALVLALALCQITTLPVDVGIDRVMMRQIVAQPREWGDRFAEVLGVKAVLASPSLVVTIGISFAYDDVVQQSILILVVAFLLESLMRTLHSAFTAFERSDLLARCIVLQRLSAAALGVGAIALGWGVVGVSAAYLVGVVVGLAWSAALLHRHIGAPHWRPRLHNWRERARLSIPFAAQDVFTVLLFKLDAVMLSILATEAIVGRYGAAYRLLESTFFITVSLGGAVAPMFTYLGPTTTPTLGRAFASSIKLGLALLAPIGVAFACLPEQICRLFFGADFEGSAEPLRILAPVVVMLGVVSLASAFVVARNRPQGIVRASAAMVALNLALNLALIPSQGASGAAIAMLVTEAVFALIVLRLVEGALADGVPWLRTLAAPVAASTAMAACALLITDALIPAVAVALAAYGLVFFAVERIAAPADLAFALDLARRRSLRSAP
jgi:O-antigen/teichoic acid export membrane protein